MIDLLPALNAYVEQIQNRPIALDRQEVLVPLIDYLQTRLRESGRANLNFICTHNSRRSQFAQIWAQTAANYHGLPVHCYSGGVEVTAFNERAVASVKRSGFQVEAQGGGNPLYLVSYSSEETPIRVFSKVFDDSENDAKQFAAIMTCDHADENCPFIPGTEQRIPVRFEDPKAYDDTPLEAEKYDERSLQIATEMFYVFSKISN